MTRRREIRPIMSGELRHVCNIEQLIEGVDATGAPLATYRLWAQNVFYAIDDWKPYEAIDAAQLGNQLNTRIRMRWRPGIVESMRLVMITNPGCSPAVYEYYDIVGAIRDIILRVEVQLTCVKRTSPGFRTGITENVAGYGGPGAEAFPTPVAPGPPGPQGPPGPPGPAGPPGAGTIAQTFVWTQNAPLATWIIAHNLGRYPDVVTVDSSGREVEGDVAYLDTNRLTVSFSAPFSGEAFLN